MAELKIKADSGGGTVSFKGPATTTSNAAVQLTLPVDDGTANQYLKTDGSGALSWATVDTSIADDSLTEAKLDIHAAPSGTDKYLGYTSNGMEWVAPALGKIKQVEYYNQISWSTQTGSTAWNGPVLTDQITPTSASSKILVIISMHVRVDSNNASTTICGIDQKVDRAITGGATTEVWRGQSWHNFPEDSGMDFIWADNITAIFVDSPATTSAVDYNVSTALADANATADVGSGNHNKAITLLEIG